jgi:hypothetical protein
MRKVAAWGLAASLVMGLGAARAGAAEAWAPTWQWSPFSGWSESKEEKKPEEKKPVEKKPAPRPELTPAKKLSAPVKPASMVDEAAAERSREEGTLLRRLQACDKLKDIAIRTNDNELLRRAEELEERAQTTYAQRTAHLRGTAGSFESDEKTIDRFLGAGKAGSQEAPAYTVSGVAHSNQAAAKEVKP